MNRHARRAAAAQKKADDRKAKLVFHTDPLDISTEHIALFAATAAQAYTIAKGIPGIEFPVHIIIESGGARVCGTVEPDDGRGEGQPFVVDKMVH